MGFWLLMLAFDMIIPLTMIGFGRYFIRSAPNKINYLFGYRTAMSMKNKDTWVFAHNFCGRLWYRWGIMLLPITLLVMLFVINGTQDTVGTVGGILCLVQLLPLAGAIIPTEKALKKTFDESGSRR